MPILSNDVEQPVGTKPLKPTVSVLTTVYNREKYIGAAIESVLKQTWQDWELIIVDDCSTDRSAEVAQHYAASDDRIRFIQNETNLGDYPNRNHASSFARGKYLKYHDSDDLMYPHCLETMVGMLRSEPRASLAASGGAWFHGGPCPMLATPRMCYQREFLGNGLFNLGPAAFLFRREAFQRLEGFPEVGVASDYAFWLRIAQTENVLLLPADLFWYRVHAGQELQSPVAQRDAAITAGQTWHALNSTKCPLSADERKQAKRNWTYIVALRIYRDLCARKFSIAAYRWRHCGLSWSDWMFYLRRMRRDHMAGTPLDEEGEFILPDWLRPKTVPDRQYYKSA